MSQSASPTNRNSIFGWVKNLKRAGVTLNDSLNEVSDDLATSESKSPSRLLFSFHSPSSQLLPPQLAIPLPVPSKESAPVAHSHLLGHLDFLRPLLNHKSRSTNNVNRIRSNSNSNQSAQDSFNLRQHRDSFLQSNPLVDENLKYFGVPLEDAIKEASAKISILGTESTSSDVLQYGRIPIVVAKCGVFLKKNGLTVEGIFRVGGLSKRIKELQIIFSTPPEFGKKLNWDGYTVHDAALVLRRYLNALPEPLIPLQLYEDFRDPLRTRQRIIKYMKYKSENPRTKMSLAAGHALPPRAHSPRLLAIAQPPVQQASNEASPMIAANSANSASLSTPQISPVPSPYPQSESTFAGNGSSSKILPTDLERDDNFLDERSSEPSALLEMKLSTSDVVASKGDSSPKKQEHDSKHRSTQKIRTYKKLTRDVYDAIDDFKLLLDELPGLSRQLLFYILDLLAMVQNNSSENLMSSRNLAAIFQPSILLHPSHDLDPEEYALSQSVVEFLIQYAYKLLPSSEPPVSRNSPQPEQSTTEFPKLSPEENTLGVRSSGRPHSRSLSSPNHVDLVGYTTTNKAARGLTLSDTEFASASSDEEYTEEHGSGLPKPSAATNLLHVLGAPAEAEEESPASAASTAPPITISDVSREVGT